MKQIHLSTMRMQRIATSFTIGLLMTLSVTVSGQKQISNVTNVDELTTLLTSEYIQETTALDAVNGVAFTFAGCRMLSGYSDAGIQQQIKTMEQEFSSNFLSSTWSFEKYNPNGQSNVVVMTSAGRKESSPYTGSKGSATVRIPLLIEGLTIEAYFFKSKNNSDQYIMMFSPGNGIACAIDLKKLKN